MIETKNRLRFAPSPTGYLHVGGARTALFNWLYVKRFGGQFLLRIEDTDKARSTDESTKAIFEGMEWLGLSWDEEVVYQGANLERHRADALKLLETGAAYRDFTTTEDLERWREEAKERKESFKFKREWTQFSPEEEAARVERGDPFAIRFKVPVGGETAWEDLVHERIAFPNKDIDDFVILRSDGTPTYNLAVVSDDIAMGITIVMRGDDHISNTPKQILLYEALGKTVPKFAHLPMIHGIDGKKLSKRHGATAVGDYQHEGLLPDALLNFLALLGWSPGEDREVMTRAEMIELFATKGLQKKAAIFDPKKLEWMNGQHLSLMTVEQLEPTVTSALVSEGVTTKSELDARPEWYHRLIDVLKIRSRLIDDIVRQAKVYFQDDIEYASDAVDKHWKDKEGSLNILKAAENKLANVDAASWDEATLEAALRGLAEELGIGAGKIFQPLRVALTGLNVSPGIFDVLILLGKDRSLRRIQLSEKYLNS